MDRNGADAILYVKAPFLGLSAEQTSRRFQIVGSGAFAEAVSIEHDRDADLQDAVINSAVIQIGSLLHNGKWNIGRDDHGLACQQPLVNHIEYPLLAKAGVAFRPQVVQYEKVGTHKRFRVMVAVRAEAALHTVDHVGYSHKEDGLQTVNQSVGNASSGIGFSCANIPEQEKPDPRFFELVPVLRVAPRLFKLGCRNCGCLKPPASGGRIYCCCICLAWE